MPAKQTLIGPLPSGGSAEDGLGALRGPLVFGIHDGEFNGEAFERNTRPLIEVKGVSPVLIEIGCRFHRRI